MSRFSRFVPWLVMVVAAAGILPFWFQRAYNHDDFFFSYTAWLRSTSLVPGHDYQVVNFTPLAEAFAPLFRGNGESFAPLIVARAAMLLPAIALVILTYFLSRAIGISREFSVLAVSLLVWMPDMIKRLSDVRSDTPASCFLVGAAILVLRRRSTIAAGLCAGCAIALAYKLAIALPFLAVGAFLLTPTTRLAAFILLCASACTIPALYYASRIALDGWPLFITTWHEVFGSVRAGAGGIRMNALGHLFRNPVIPVAIAVGCAGMIKRRALGYMVSVLGFIVVFVAANPFLFAYNFVVLMPLAIPLAGGMEQFIRGRAKDVASITLPIVAMTFGLPAVADTVYQNNTLQIAFVRWIWSATSPGERIYDGRGMHWGRRGTFHWWLFTPRYRGRYSVAQELRESKVSMIIDNGRFSVLTPEDGHFIDRHYVRFAPCVLVPGFVVTEPVVEVIVPGDYRALTTDPAAFTIDGHALQAVQRLGAGRHVITRARNSALALMFTTPLRERTRPPCQEGGFLNSFAD